MAAFARGRRPGARSNGAPDQAMEPAAASDFAWMIFASVEGALVFARAERSMRALDLVERQLLAFGASLV